MTGISAEVSGDVALSIGEFRHGINKLHSALRQNKSPNIRKEVTASGVFPAAAPLLLNLGGPPVGCMWFPLWITVTGSDDHTAVANSQVAVYLGGQSSTAPALRNLLIPASAATAVPYWQQVSGKEDIGCHYGDELFVLVWGAVAAGSNLVASARIREVHPSGAEELNLLL